MPTTVSALDDDNEDGLDFSSKPQKKKSNSLYWNYVIFCVCFSISHGSMDSCLEYASSELGPSLASDAGSALYCFYTLSALLIAKPIVMYMGPKNSILLGLLGFLCYVASFFFAIVFSGFEWGIFITGASIGGIGAGLAWTAQGAYYSRNAHQYGVTAHSIQTQVNANFAAIFAATYLGFETFTAVMATLVYLIFKGVPAWRPVVFGSYTILSLCSMVLCTNLYPLELDVPPEVSWKSVETEVTSVGKSIFTSKRLALLVPYQICFGLHAGFIGQYVNRKIVAEGLGDGYIGIVAALATLTATILAAPYAKISNISSKYNIMAFGAFCFSFCGAVLLVFSDAQIGTWGFVVPYYIIHGAARGVWENTSKAVIADYFESEQERETAYAAVYFTSGVAGALGYFSFQFMDRLSLSLLNTLLPLVAFICYHFSFQNSPEHEMLRRSRQAVASAETRTNGDNVYVTMNVLNGMTSVSMDDDGAEETTVTFN